ncbi:MAG TPA: hypothetical protein VGF53_02530 [Pseudolabrys sp.]|jgi:hypothetical protein
MKTFIALLTAMLLATPAYARNWVYLAEDDLFGGPPMVWLYDKESILINNTGRWIMYKNSRLDGDDSIIVFHTKCDGYAELAHINSMNQPKVVDVEGPVLKALYQKLCR